MYWKTKISALGFGASYFKIRYHIYLTLMVSVYKCIKIENSQNLCMNKYVLTALLEVTSKLLAHSTSLIKVVTVYEKQLQTDAWECAMEESYLGKQK